MSFVFGLKLIALIVVLQRPVENCSNTLTLQSGETLLAPYQAGASIYAADLLEGSATLQFYYYKGGKITN